MQAPAHSAWRWLSPSWVMLTITCLYACANLSYRMTDSVKVKTSPPSFTRTSTVTDPVTGKTHTVKTKTIVCGTMPPELHADTSTGERRALAKLFQPAMKVEEMGRRAWDSLEDLARQVWRSW